MPDIEGDKPQKKTCKPDPIGYFLIDMTEVRTAEGKLHLFVASGRVSQFASAERHEAANKMVAAQFLRH